MIISTIDLLLSSRWLRVRVGWDLAFTAVNRPSYRWQASMQLNIKESKMCASFFFFASSLSSCRSVSPQQDCCYYWVRWEKVSDANAKEKVNKTHVFNVVQYAQSLVRFDRRNGRWIGSLYERRLDNFTTLSCLGDYNGGDLLPTYARLARWNDQL